jgi:hypothetical protein
MIFINGVAFEKVFNIVWIVSCTAPLRFIGHILLSVLSGNTCVLPTLVQVVVLHLKGTKKSKKQQILMVPSTLLRLLDFINSPYLK